MANDYARLDAPRWATAVLLLAATYNLVWGAWVVLAPTHAFGLTGLAAPRYPEIWQCLGMVIGVYGIGYAIASRSPYRHWPIVLVGLLGKLFGPIGYLWFAYQGTVPWAGLWLIVFNDLVWWVPFAGMLFGARSAIVASAGDR